VHKIVTKIIANRLQPVPYIEQFGFLLDRKILDAMGMAQECIHSINSNKIKALVLKLDFHKVYDCISWGFLWMVWL
jgi:hypothetical protein